MKYLTTILLLLFSPLIMATDNVVPDNLIQLIINHSSLDQYWHPEQKDRVPLNVLHKHIEAEAELTKFEQNIVLINQSGTKPYFEIVDFLIENEQWTIKVQYSVEGITVVFVGKIQSNGQWRLISGNIVEN